MTVVSSSSLSGFRLRPPAAAIPEDSLKPRVFVLVNATAGALEPGSASFPGIEANVRLSDLLVLKALVVAFTRHGHLAIGAPQQQIIAESEQLVTRMALLLEAMARIRADQHRIASPRVAGTRSGSGLWPGPRR